MIEVVSISLGERVQDVEVETYTYYNRLRSIRDNYEITLFQVKSIWRGGTIKWMEYSR
jgi:hypothetical protein